MRFVLITSNAEVCTLSAEGSDAASVCDDVEGLKISVAPSANEKCARGWHHREEVGKDEAHPELCGRCIDNVDGNGEKRLYA